MGGCLQYHKGMKMMGGCLHCHEGRKVMGVSALPQRKEDDSNVFYVFMKVKRVSEDWSCAGRVH